MTECLDALMLMLPLNQIIDSQLELSLVDHVGSISLPEECLNGISGPPLVGQRAVTVIMEIN